MDDETPKPALLLEDVQRGWKEIEVELKSGDKEAVRVTAVTYADIAAIYLEHKNHLDPEIERKLVRASLPAELPPAWLDWLDWESRGLVVRLAREFAFGFLSEQKRNAEVRRVLDLYTAWKNSTAGATAPENAAQTPAS